jgi:hypothetical protein
MNDYLTELTKVVRQRHGREAEHIQTVLVNEIVDGDTVWDGMVEVFSLRWNPKAKYCYAWGRPKAEGGCDITTVLGIRSVVSAHSAVRAAIAQKVNVA